MKRIAALLFFASSGLGCGSGEPGFDIEVEPSDEYTVRASGEVEVAATTSTGDEVAVVFEREADYRVLVSEPLAIASSDLLELASMPNGIEIQVEPFSHETFAFHRAQVRTTICGDTQLVGLTEIEGRRVGVKFAIPDELSVTLDLGDQAPKPLVAGSGQADVEIYWKYDVRDDCGLFSCDGQECWNVSWAQWDDQDEPGEPSLWEGKCQRGWVFCRCARDS